MLCLVRPPSVLLSPSSWIFSFARPPNTTAGAAPSSDEPLFVGVKGEFKDRFPRLSFGMANDKPPSLLQDFAAGWVNGARCEEEVLLSNIGGGT